mmetsp:Transcript_23575/g.31617  ORF Transcript_23575/g.31617 Transcript_23575/m.31617 type:complete len:85 (+) Transcript_23575:501-755(+)|eukprot:CAMPEP_0185582744 /NCGR_PEP_ID=MMETSP0434-20130131/21097_1 /TAXON_ID=626734 ORGANISM="Favella taraikaensis, Strain Fe Narragansett Bay" /NCGR_SAMPLE_ID=MMETSP0434 /ASSEMBLY_ACC=CAM_ASM_000379 /LENGTH=84 /DNA_ID=CAMNT_0028201655 /DNA_START=501 /DNA_END=755 /DNA_ORIENTATION=+
MNLDEETVECPVPECGTPFHPECMRQQLDIKCAQCKQALPRNLVYAHVRARNTTATAEEEKAAIQGNAEPSKRQRTGVDSAVVV